MMETRKYKATACGPGCPDTMDSGTLWFTSEGASFKGTAAEFMLPMEGLRIDRAGAIGDTLRITNPAYPDWFISTTDLAMLREPVLVSHGGLRASINEGRRQGLCFIGGCLAMLVLAVLVVVLIVAGWDALLAALANHFPPK